MNQRDLKLHNLRQQLLAASAKGDMGRAQIVQGKIRKREELLREREERPNVDLRASPLGITF